MLISRLTGGRYAEIRGDATDWRISLPITHRRSTRYFGAVSDTVAISWAEV